jgi:hypothetical protein
MNLEHSEFSRNQLLTLFHKPCKFRLAPADKLNQVLWYGHLEPHHYDASAQRFGFGLGGCPRAYLTVGTDSRTPPGSQPGGFHFGAPRPSCGSWCAISRLLSGQGQALSRDFEPLAAIENGRDD